MMLDDAALLALGPYQLKAAEKRALLNRELAALTALHRQGCPAYDRMLRTLGYEGGQDYTALPPLPVRLFKELALKSVPDEQIYRTMTSSGTTGQQVSRIYLDRETGALQSKVLAKIVSSYLGASRLPMIVLDTEAAVKSRESFSARGAGILGFSIFARDRVFAFDEHMNLNVDGLKDFLARHEGESLFLFGFTFMIWQYFYQALKETNWRPDLSRGVLIHGGGWKKLSDQAVSHEAFKAALKDVCGVEHVHDYYGMVEQTGTIYVECECGHLHAPVWSDVLIRRPGDFSLAEPGEKGLIEVVSLLPRSYPGHALLTEDEGEWIGEDDCPCGRPGRTFRVLGRVKKAEIRGCSDTYERR